MIIAIWIVGSLVASIALMAAIGLCLDRNHTASRTIALKRPQAEVFAVVSDVTKTAAWRDDVKSIDVLPPDNGRTRFREHSNNGPILFEVAESAAPARLVVRIADETLAFGGRWVFELAPEGEGCRIRITEEGFVKNPVFRFLSRTVFSPAATLETYLRALGRKFGEKVEPAP